MRASICTTLCINLLGTHVALAKPITKPSLNREVAQAGQSVNHLQMGPVVLMLDKVYAKCCATPCTSCSRLATERLRAPTMTLCRLAAL